MKKDILVKFGQHIKYLRQQNHLSQEQLAELAGVHRTYIGMLERGEKNATIETLYKLSTSLGIPMSALLELENIDE